MIVHCPHLVWSGSEVNSQIHIRLRDLDRVQISPFHSLFPALDFLLKSSSMLLLP